MRQTSTDASTAPPPVIGLTCYVEPGDHPHWGTDPGAVIDMRYVRSIERAGAVVVIVPPREDFTDAMADATVAALDGLVISGGGDLDPARYGKQLLPTDGMIRADRDETEIRLAAAARRARLPLLGICRGHQIMAVEAGGTLVQHIEETSVVHNKVGGYEEHVVTTLDGSLARRVLGEQLTIFTSHHQAVESAPGYTVSAHAEDGLVEAIEDPDQPYCLGVQWHPERGDHPGVFDGLVEAARARRA